MKSLFVLTLTTAGALAGGSDLLQPVRSHGWYTKSVSAGIGWRSFGDLSYRGGTRSQNITINPVIPSSSLNFPPIGTEGAIGVRVYNDGYVDQDAATPGTGDTWFWGYDNSGQLQGDNLVFSATGERTDFSETRSFAGPSFGKDDLEGFAPQIDFVFAPPSHVKLPFDGILVSLAHFADSSASSFSNFNVQQTSEDYRLDIRDFYDVSGIVVPQAPYNGNFNGPGPLILNRPTDREQTDVLLQTSTADISNLVSTSLSLDALSLAVGPTKSGRFNGKWHWQASAGLTLNVFKWRANQSETLTASISTPSGPSSQQLASSQDRNSGTDFRLGAYVKGELIRELNQDWFVKSYLQAEVADSLSMSVGPSTYKLEPGGWTLGLSFGRSF